MTESQKIGWFILSLLAWSAAIILFPSAVGVGSLIVIGIGLLSVAIGLLSVAIGLISGRIHL